MSGQLRCGENHRDHAAWRRGDRIRRASDAATHFACCLAVLLAACSDDAPTGPTCPISVVRDSFELRAVDKLDLLLVVDNSPSMVEEQTALAAAFPRLMLTLATGDLNPDDGIEPMRDFEAFGDIQAGVVTTDLGSGGFPVSFSDMSSGDPAACPHPARGDDGVLRTEGSSATGCAPSYPAFLSFAGSSGADPAAFAADVGCVADVSTSGCGYEQPLEAALKALSRPDNAGFVRSDSLLAVIVVSDEDDCSVADPELFNPMSTVHSGASGLRCFNHPEALHPTERYVDGLLGLREDPSRLVFASVVGVPPWLVANPDAISYEAVLADPDMVATVDPADPNRLLPACEVPGRGLAFPARRIVGTTRALAERGVRTMLQSLCLADFTSALATSISRVASPSTGFCLPRALVPNATGVVQCEVTETLPATGDFITCASLRGRELLRRVEDGREVCRVAQVPTAGGTIPSENGWYYDNFSSAALMQCGRDGQRLAYTPSDEPKDGTTVDIECRYPPDSVDIAIWSSCDRGCDGAGLACDMASNTCQQPCATTNDCEAAGLSGWHCGEGRFCRIPGCS